MPLFLEIGIKAGYLLKDTTIMIFEDDASRIVFLR